MNRVPMMQDFSLGSLYDDVINGGANRNSAEATSSAAAATQQQAADTRSKAVGAVTQTPEELLGISNQYANASAFMSAQLGNLQNSMNLLNSTQPALMQAGIQAYQLMNGQAAASLAPIQNERSLQRTQLENSLQAKMGSGYQTSSAGMEALSQFDQQTANLMTNAQQGAIAQYLGISASVMPNMTNLTNSVYGEGSNLRGAAIGATQQSQGMMSNAITGTAQAMYNSAGAPWAGQAQYSNATSQYGNAAFGALIGGGAKMMSGSGGGGGGGGGSQSYNGLDTSGDSAGFMLPQIGSGAAGGSGAAAAMAG